MKEHSFLTISVEASFEFVEKKSRFIGFISRADSEERAMEFINSIRAKNWEAKHNVFAYSVNRDGFSVQRCSDDGEPQGTAGTPVLQVVKNKNLDNVAIVVTRYFGGILLGASGLVRAYGKCASLVVEAAGISKFTLCIPIAFSFEYSFYGSIQRAFEDKGVIVQTPIFGEKVSITYIVPVGKIDFTINLITNLTSANFKYTLGEKGYWEV